jgi:hypothetical protein
MKKIILFLLIITLVGFQAYAGPWGRLKLIGNQLSSEDGQPVQLRGWSSHGFQWTGAYYNDYNDFTAMKENGANIFRIALYIQENGWQNKEWVQNCIDWTAQLNMYCLFDWHVLTPGDPRKYLLEGGLKDGKGNPVDAEAFFEWITSYVKEKGYNHVLYEICNEPNGDNNVMWSYVKEYAARILPVIAKNDPGAITIVGTASWSQRIDWAVSNPIENTFGLPVMYAFHFYAGTQ